MKNTIFVLAALLVLLSACSWAMNDQATVDCTLPTTQTPSELVGEWANGFSSFTQVVDVYNGKLLGHTWQSGKYFSFTADGQNAQLYVTGQSRYASFATQATGTVRFDPESTDSRGSFTFLALKAHYKGWGSASVDRDATPTELKNNLTRKYHYRKEGDWLRIEAGAEPNDHSSSFRKM